MKRLVFVALLFAAAVPAVAQDRPIAERPHDEFGLIPEDRTGRRGDPDLSLPDPRLDPDALLPEPGEGHRKPEGIASDEDESDPFRIEEPPRPPGISPPAPPPSPKLPSGMAPSPAPAPRPAVPPVGPDGRRDTGTPVPEADPSLRDALEPDAPAPSEIEEDEMQRSPYEKDNALMDDESDDMFDDGSPGGRGE